MVAGPVSTVDLESESGASIVIEERDADEVRHVGGRLITLAGVECRNPAFDVTPASLISALVTDRGVLSPVDGVALRSLVAPVAA